jgi:hypothetical protein
MTVIGVVISDAFTVAQAGRCRIRGLVMPIDATPTYSTGFTDGQRDGLARGFTTGRDLADCDDEIPTVLPPVVMHVAFQEWIAEGIRRGYALAEPSDDEEAISIVVQSATVISAPPDVTPPPDPGPGPPGPPAILAPIDFSDESVPTIDLVEQALGRLPHMYRGSSG